ncbi:transmembrane protein 272-like [Mugil cephalus]|uniref:transmembrane protein 272-like n=1 Tax=Mugil cephalus TaxID=48193 RepID=UPI001FB5AEF3|nr:transmembrane protein 272-like [Mugil cephalus]
MAAPSAGQPVAITVGTVWRFQVRPPPPTSPRLTVGAVVVCCVLTVARVIFGVVYFKDCPQQPNIPNYLLGLALITLINIPFVTLPCDFHPRENPRGCKAVLQGLIGLFIFIWILLGDVWVLSVYQPNYDPTSADGLYCNKTLYTFAFWNAVFESVGLGVLFPSFCKGIMFYVVMTPVPSNTDFYGQV